VSPKRQETIGGRKPFHFKLDEFLDDFYWALAEFSVMREGEK
jgi:hypothetical protein